MRGRRCYLGLDLSTTTDLTAQAAVFPPDDDDGTWHVALRFFVPQENMRRRADRDGVPYPQWGTPGRAFRFRITLIQGKGSAQSFRERTGIRNMGTGSSYGRVRKR